ncbi:helix-turn-helix transcriptional regulator [Saccharopolyspora taberi]|uniref:HTH cro/C1-type domain-containing protein n=1 Tax=Saccharopolyspora taberi TaxID=60895 RepID=A0ABN3UZP9_9PSEU
MRDTDDVQDWATYIADHLGRRGWEVRDLAAAADISPSVVFRWKNGQVPNIKNARAAAKVLGVPLLEILVVAGIITPEEARASVTAPAGLSGVSDDELVAEMHRRLRRTDGD